MSEIFSYSAEEDSLLALNARHTSIFDLKASDDDFIPTVPLTEELNAFLLSTRDMAGEITRRYDKKMRAKKEEKGQAWQNSRRGTKQATKDRRAAAERPLWDALVYAKTIHLMLTEQIQPVEADDSINEYLEGKLAYLKELASSPSGAMDLQEELDEAYGAVQKLEEKITINDPTLSETVKQEALVFLGAHADELNFFTQEEL